MKNAFEYEAELAELREELAKANASTERYAMEGIRLTNCLTAAEQRNAQCIAILRRSTAGDGQDLKTWWNDRALILQAELTKPTEFKEQANEQ